MFATPSILKTDRADGSFVLQSADPLGDYPANICQHLHTWADQAPDRVFLADRLGQDRAWRKISYGAALGRVRGLAQALLDLGASAQAPLAILSDNSMDNGLLQLAAMYVGVPAVPISPAYSLISQDHAKLKHIIDLVSPGLVFVQDGAQFASPLQAIQISPDRIIAACNVPHGAHELSTLLATSPSSRVDQKFARTGPDTIAKILFTSGSTGLPKGVMNSQRMICANQQMIAQIWPFIEQKPPVILDWLPWNHTFGGNHNFNMMLRNGGSIYVDDGKPAPHLIARTLENLLDVSPTLSFNVPRGYEMMLPGLEQSSQLRDAFFNNLDMVFYAAAALPQNIWQRLEALSMAARGEHVAMLSSWGATETGPLAAAVHFHIDRAGVIGNPVPGTAIKLVPDGDKLEMRVKGPSVTTGYLSDPEKTSAAFDGEGFYKTGDAGRLADPDDAAKGLVFDGRTAENFKLGSGTWVSVGALRLAIIGAAPNVVQDAVIAGHDGNEIGVLIFPNVAGIKALCPQAPADAPLADLITHGAVVSALRQGLIAHNRENPAGNTTVSVAMIVADPASIDANEITDKGYLNQRAVLQHRRENVEGLFSRGPGCVDIIADQDKI